MQELELALLITINTGGLDVALRAALPGKVVGVSTYGVNRPIIIWLEDSATAGDKLTATNLANVHDPVFIVADKQQITADGVDAATISVTAPKPGAAAVTLVCTKPDGTTDTEAISLTAGAGSMSFDTVIPGIYTISVQSPANRSADAITITGV